MHISRAKGSSQISNLRPEMLRCLLSSVALRYSCSSRKPAESETAPSDENEDLQEMETKKKKPCEAEQLSKMKYPRFNLKKVRLKKGPEPFLASPCHNLVITMLCNTEE